MKAIVADMQQKIAEQDATINILSQRVDEVEREKDRINDAVGKHVFTIDSRITKEVEALKEDLEHKFALQVAENKRLLNQLVKQKNDEQWQEAEAMEKLETAEEQITQLLEEVERLQERCEEQEEEIENLSRSAQDMMALSAAPRRGRSSFLGTAATAGKTPTGAPKPTGRRERGSTRNSATGIDGLKNMDVV